MKTLLIICLMVCCGVKKEPVKSSGDWIITGTKDRHPLRLKLSAKDSALLSEMIKGDTDLLYIDRKKNN